MRLKLTILMVLSTLAINAFAASQWSPEDFVSMASDGRVTVDATAAGSSSLVILSNTVGMEGNHAMNAPVNDMLMMVTRDIPNSRIPYLRIYPLRDYISGVGPEGGLLDIGVNGETFQEGDTIEFLRWDWDEDFSMDALTPSLATAGGGQAPADFNDEYGVENYFQTYANGDNFDGVLTWTFGIAFDDSYDGGDKDTSPNVSGQPLPGVLATMLIGSVVLTAVRKKKRETI